MHSKDLNHDVILQEQLGRVLCLTLNRQEKRNAFDDTILLRLQTLLDDASQNSQVKVVLLNANGPDFCAGADLEWMQRMAHYSEEENLKDAEILANLMDTLYHFPKPTISMIQGHAMGGGAGLAACTDITIAATSAKFCFSEVKLGLIPAVISPYVIKAIGERMALSLFITAKLFDAEQAKSMGLVHEVVDDAILENHAYKIAHRIAALAPNALNSCKALVREVGALPIDNHTRQLTAKIIAKIRVSEEGQKGLQAFLNKETPTWT